MGRQSTYPPPPVAIDLDLPAPIAARPRPARHVPQFTRARDSHAWWVRAVNAIGGSFEPVGKPSADIYWERAQRLNPDAGEPTTNARAALTALTESLNQDAALSFIGKIAAWIDCTRMAGTHLRVLQALRETPAIEETALPTPVFVLGLFRSGTTVLHRLLGEDPDNRTLPHWESFDPVHTPEGPERRQRKLTNTLMLADILSPSIRAIHPMDAYQTDECRGMFTNVFRTPQFNVQYRVGGYLDWLLAQDATIAYRQHRRQLQLVQYHRPYGTRFILKDPTHTFFVKEILAVFPDARFVFIHRNPIETLSSICSLHAYARSVFSTDVEAKSIGAELSDSYMTRLLEPAVAAVDRLPAGRVAHVRAPDLSRDPVGTIADAYRTLGMDLGNDARTAMHGYLREKREKPAPHHVHGTEGFGLDAGVIHERFASYCARFELLR
ncbi:MAG: sulfotransferase [Deltaproteobacteria bacterium]|nr:sulfotransferase [Deltaproteobacteria bacterium]